MRHLITSWLFDEIQIWNKEAQTASKSAFTLGKTSKTLGKEALSNDVDSDDDDEMYWSQAKPTTNLVSFFEERSRYISIPEDIAPDCST